MPADGLAARTCAVELARRFAAMGVRLQRPRAPGGDRTGDAIWSGGIETPAAYDVQCAGCQTQPDGVWVHQPDCQSGPCPAAGTYWPGCHT